MSIEGKYTYEQIKEIADHILSRTEQRPTLGIICGSGLGGLADTLEAPEEMEYTTIPNFPVSTVKGHGGKLVFGKIEGVSCVCMKGRFHFYEGYPIWKTAAPVQVMALMGVKALIVTNAAGGLNPDFNVGDMMLITDHINLVGLSGFMPLRGPNDERFGPRFPATNNTYSKELQDIFRKAADELSMTVLGVSLITNKCIVDVKETHEPNHAEVLEMAKKRGEDMQNLVKLTVRWGQHVWTQGME